MGKVLRSRFNIRIIRYNRISGLYFPILPLFEIQLNVFFLAIWTSVAGWMEEMTMKIATNASEISRALS